MKGTENAYEGENRSLHMKERIGYGVGDFANNMMYTPVNSFFTYFLTNVAGLGAGVVGTILLVSRLLDGVSDLIVGSLMENTANTVKQDPGFCGGAFHLQCHLFSCSQHRILEPQVKSSMRSSLTTWQ